MKLFRAFTLAEVLITLGLIGVVSAMTLPGIMQNTRHKELQVKLKKAYSDWNQVAMKFMDEHNETVGSYAIQYGSHATLEEITKQFTTQTKSGNAWGDPYKRYTMNGRVITGGQPCDDTNKFSEIQGQIFNIDIVRNAAFNGPRLCIDLNGKDKPKIWGIDIFSFVFTTDGHIIPEGQHHQDNNYDSAAWSVGGTVKASSENCSPAAGSIKNLLGCTYYAINDESPIGQGFYWKDFISRKQYRR